MAEERVATRAQRLPPADLVHRIAQPLEDQPQLPLGREHAEHGPEAQRKPRQVANLQVGCDQRQQHHETRQTVQGQPLRVHVQPEAGLRQDIRLLGVQHVRGVEARADYGVQGVRPFRGGAEEDLALEACRQEAEQAEHVRDAVQDRGGGPVALEPERIAAEPKAGHSHGGGRDRHALPRPLRHCEEQ